MKNSIPIHTQKTIVSLYILLGFCIFLHLAIDYLAMHLYSSSVHNKSHFILLLFYCFFIAFPIANLRKSMTLCVAFVLQNNCMSVPQNGKSIFINCISTDNPLFYRRKKRCFTDTPGISRIFKSVIFSSLFISPPGKNLCETLCTPCALC
jgi:hypothetical protein